MADEVQAPAGGEQAGDGQVLDKGVGVDEPDHDADADVTEAPGETAAYHRLGPHQIANVAADEHGGAVFERLRGGHRQGGAVQHRPLTPHRGVGFVMDRVMNDPDPDNILSRRS